MNYRQVYAMKNRHRAMWLKICPTLNDNSGIYILTREENGFKFAYIGQAKHLLDRLASHLQGYDQHIDKSLRKHKLWSERNTHGWGVDFVEVPESELDKKEQEFIKEYANMGYQLLNKTAGSQGSGKVGLDLNKSSKGYFEGLRNGYNKAIREIKVLFDKYLYFGVKKQGQISWRKYNEFEQMLRGEENESKDN